MAAGDIYADRYEGYYNVKEETFVPPNEAELNDFKDPDTGIPLEKRSEDCYFFRMSKYQDKLLEHIAANPEFIQPEKIKNEILARLKEPLRDLSVTRTTFDWGIPVPDAPGHVMYVWFDALTNYLTGWYVAFRSLFLPEICFLLHVALLSTTRVHVTAAIIQMVQMLNSGLPASTSLAKTLSGSTQSYGRYASLSKCSGNNNSAAIDGSELTITWL
eukprot:SAG31_NODE_1781_length_7282_cov_1.770291_6_plen_216_part_00